MSYNCILLSRDIEVNPAPLDYIGKNILLQNSNENKYNLQPKPNTICNKTLPSHQPLENYHTHT